MPDLPLSVVIPLFNKRPFIAAAVDSVLRQSHAAFELLVIDDGSTDGGAEALAAIGDARLRIVTQPNGGVASARNRGLAGARHDWVALLDADDWWAPGHLAEIAALASANPSAGIVAASVRQMRGGTPIDAERAPPYAHETIDYFARAARDILVVHTSATALRRAAALEIGGFRDLRPGQDIDCWSRMALRWPVVVSTRQTAFYARETGGAMAAWSATKRSRSDIARLADFGGAIQSLSDALDTGRYEDRRKSIEAYVDARILSGVGRCIAAGDLANARRRLGFVHDRRTREYRRDRLLAILPPAVVAAGIGAYRRIRAILRG